MSKVLNLPNRIILKSFALDYLSWVKDYAPEGGIFLREVGLCSNYRRWVQFNKISCGYDDLLIQYIQNDSSIEDKSFPFGKNDYAWRQARKTMYLCPERVEYARKLSLI